MVYKEVSFRERGICGMKNQILRNECQALNSMDVKLIVIVYPALMDQSERYTTTYVKRENSAYA